MGHMFLKGQDVTRKGERTRRFILERAAHLFNTKGYSQTSLLDIMDATGLSKGTIYGRFEDKTQLALAAFDYNLKLMVSRIDSEMDKCTTVREKMIVYVRLYNMFWKPGGGCPILNVMQEGDDSSPMLKEKLKWAVGRWKKKLVGLLETGIQVKEFHSSIDAEQIATAFIALLEGAVMLNKTLDDVKTSTLITGYVEKMVADIPAGLA